MNENKVKVWLARDKDGFVGGHKLKPDKMDGEWQDAGLQLLDVESWFNFDTTNIKWEDDEPTEAYITLAKPQEEKEIDWEQRRYEIAKSLFVHHSEIGGRNAIRFADKLIEELKWQSE